MAEELLGLYSPNRIYRNKTLLDKDDDKTLLDRFKLVHKLSVSGRLRCAILSTFTLNLGYLCEVMPNLFGPQTTIPTLVLYGNKQRSSVTKEMRSLQKSESTNLRLVEIMPFHNFKCAKDISKKKEFDTRTEFGTILDDFLQQQDEAIQILSQRDPTEEFTPPLQRDAPSRWLGNIFGLTTVSLDALYDFSESRVALITSVPIITNKDDQRYGHRRIAAALKSANKTSHRVVIQPTSIGDNILDSYLRQLETSYQAEKVQIMWPSMRHVINAIKHLHHVDRITTQQQNSSPISVCKKKNASPLHCPCEFWAKLGFDVKSSIAQYTSLPNCDHLLPHCKFVFSTNQNGSTFDWLLLTSMCLSRGACGDLENGKYSLRNFEMGVLFLHNPPPVDSLPFKVIAPAYLQSDANDTLKGSFVPFVDIENKSISIRQAFPGTFGTESFLPEAHEDLKLLDDSTRRYKRPAPLANSDNFTNEQEECIITKNAKRQRSITTPSALRCESSLLFEKDHQQERRKTIDLTPNNSQDRDDDDISSSLFCSLSSTPVELF